MNKSDKTFYKEIYSGDIVEESEYDIIWEGELGCYIESEQAQDYYLDDDLSDINQYQPCDESEVYDELLVDEIDLFEGGFDEFDDIGLLPFESNLPTAEYVYTKAIEFWGGDLQLDVLIEEMAELTQALIKRKRGTYDNIDEEIADVEIMLEQAKIILNLHHDVFQWKELKFKRMAKKIGILGDVE